MQEVKGQVITLQVFAHQVSGKEPKLISNDGTKILKGFNQNEEKFYRKVFETGQQNISKLKHFVPCFHGTMKLQKAPILEIEPEHQNEWLTHLSNRYSQRNQQNSFIILQNLTLNYQNPCIFDIKIGGRNIEKKHKITKSVSKYFVKLNGCKISNFDKGGSMLLTKYFMGDVMELEDITQYFALFFSKQNKIIEQVLIAIREKMKKLINAFKEVKGYRFISTSLCIFYDNSDYSKNDVRLIDFGRVTLEDENFQDQESLQGMQNIFDIISSISQNIVKNEETLPTVRQRCLESQVLHIPEHKRSKPCSSTSL